MAARYRRFIILAAAVVLADQGVKLYMTSILSPGQSQAIIPGLFSLVMWHNPGAAFGGLSGISQARWLLSGVTVAALGVILFLLRGSWGSNIKAAACLGLVAGGAAGNLIDRLRLGWVIDYILVYYRDWYWPAFNLADMGITLGGLLLVVFMWKKS
ncbi:MAG: signal peptidase II [Desulfarculales bacterium]|jgi:signal peptidase II|nr:signal peptidase II [Desulfarculales bacterium]